MSVKKQRGRPKIRRNTAIYYLNLDVGKASRADLPTKSKTIDDDDEQERDSKIYDFSSLIKMTSDSKKEPERDDENMLDDKITWVNNSSTEYGSAHNIFFLKFQMI